MSFSVTDALTHLVSPQPANLAHFSTDWEGLYKVAKQHSLTPLLHARLEPILERLPNAIQEKLREERRHYAAHAMFLEFELSQIVGSFRHQNIPLIVFKGIPLARQLFDDPGLRPMVDIDVLVRTKDVTASLDLVSQIGWQAPDTPQPFQIKACELTKEVFGALIYLELHWSNQRKGEYDLPEERLWEETVETDEGTLFTPEMALFTLVLHAARHSFRPYRQLVDIAHAVARWNETLNWARVVELAEEARAFAMLATVLALVQRELKIPNPKHARLVGKMNSRRIQLTIRYLTSERLLYQHSSSNLDRYWVPLASGAWQPATFFFSDMLRTPKQIAHIYNLPENSPLLPIYVLLRPFLLARKYVQRALSR